MTITIDFTNEENALLLYNNNKSKIDQKIIDCFNLSNDEITNELTIRFPVSEFENNFSIKGMTFKVKNKQEAGFDLLLTKIEKQTSP